MNTSAFNMEEFIKKDTEPAQQTVEETSVEEVEEVAELDVQKAVVEELAADKAKLHEQMASKEDEISRLTAELEKVKDELAKKNAEVFSLQASLEGMKATTSALYRLGDFYEMFFEDALLASRELDLQERNPNALALLDRDIDLPDRFPGETRDHVLEVVKEARDKAEAEGYLRKAQVLEGVLVSNEPNGNLAKKRAQLEKLFAENGNIISGPVLEELQRQGISHKNGEEYLLPDEILRRTY